MSFKKAIVFPANPNSVRGESTKLSASKSKIAYASGKVVIVRLPLLFKLISCA
jgi:hypothetical protein